MTVYKEWSALSNRVEFEPQDVIVGDASSGIRIHYTKARRDVTVSGWFDHIAGIQSASVPLADFLAALGVSEADLRAVLRAWRDGGRP